MIRVAAVLAALLPSVAVSQMVVVMKDGQRHTFNVADVARIEFGGAAPVTPTAVPAPPPAPATRTVASFVAKFTSGQQMTGVARSPDGKAWAFNIKVTRYIAGTGELTGIIEWPSLQSTHNIQGTLKGDALKFTEVSAIRPGGAHLNSSYDLTIVASGATGFYIDNASNPPRGGVQIDNK
jgi:hypothetical protein